MPQGLSRDELVAIAEKLMPIADGLTSGEIPWSPEIDRLVEQFDEEIPLWEMAADLIFNWKHEFKDAGELVDFALGLEKPRKLSRAELIDVTKKLMTADISSDIESERLGRSFTANIPHPAGTDLIFYPEIHFQTAEELVDYALSYKPDPEWK
jgi:Colicin immunity protein / pyocin immunity protein